MERCSATVEPLGDPAAAGELWSQIDHELVTAHRGVPLYNPRTATALAARVWNVLLDQLWVR